jgi:hypothetical protein
LQPAGVVGISAACLGAHVMLTDTRDILPQIMENVQENGALVEAAGGSATVQELDWNQPDDEVRRNNRNITSLAACCVQTLA